MGYTGKKQVNDPPFSVFVRLIDKSSLLKSQVGLIPEFIPKDELFLIWWYYCRLWDFKLVNVTSKIPFFSYIPVASPSEPGVEWSWRLPCSLFFCEVPL